MIEVSEERLGAALELRRRHAEDVGRAGLDGALDERAVEGRREQPVVVEEPALCGRQVEVGTGREPEVGHEDDLAVGEECS